MSVAQSKERGNPAARGVEEDILVPLLARLATIRTVLDNAPAPSRRRLPVHVRDAEEDARVEARALLEKVQGEMSYLQRVFRRIDEAENSILYGFDPVEEQIDDALQQAQVGLDVEQVHEALLAVDADIEVIKASIREVYRFPCDGDERRGPHRRRPRRPRAW